MGAETRTRPGSDGGLEDIVVRLKVWLSSRAAVHVLVVVDDDDDDSDEDGFSAGCCGKIKDQADVPSFSCHWCLRVFFFAADVVVITVVDGDDVTNGCCGC